MRQRLLALPMLAVGVAMLALMTGCSSNEVKTDETFDSKQTGEFTKVVFVEQEPTADVDPGVRATLATDLTNYFEKQIQALEDEERRAQSMGYLKNLKMRKLTVKYKIVLYDKGNPVLRRVLRGFLGIGAAKLSIESSYVDDNGTQLATNRINAALAQPPNILNDDADVLGAMMVKSEGDYIIKTKNYLLKPENYMKKS